MATPERNIQSERNPSPTSSGAVATKEANLVFRNSARHRLSSYNTSAIEPSQTGGKGTRSKKYIKAKAKAKTAARAAMSRSKPTGTVTPPRSESVQQIQLHVGRSGDPRGSEEAATDPPVGLGRVPDTNEAGNPPDGSDSSGAGSEDDAISEGGFELALNPAEIVEKLFGEGELPQNSTKMRGARVRRDKRSKSMVKLRHVYSLSPPLPISACDNRAREDSTRGVGHPADLDAVTLNDDDLDGIQLTEEEYKSATRCRRAWEVLRLVTTQRKSAASQLRAVPLRRDTDYLSSGKVVRGGKIGAPLGAWTSPSGEPPRKIGRHSSRGDTLPSRKDLREQEDALCNAGMRNPSRVCQRWQGLVTAMMPVRAALLTAYHRHPDLQQLPLAVGENAVRSPPTEASIDAARAAVAEALGICREERNLRHPAGKWRYAIVQAVQKASGDPDIPLGSWLKDGAPQGIVKSITPGGLFPLCHSPAEASSLEGLMWGKGNHPSFNVVREEGQPSPGVKILRDYFKSGYAHRYTSVEAATAIHGELVLSPLGTLSKPKPDGTIKDRIIQDLRRGGANLLAELFERIVLPRPGDHGWDLYDLWVQLAGQTIPKEASVWSLIVDFKDAFMSTGTLEEEQRFTAAQVDDDESPTGTYVYIWRTLGFGGKTFPLVYARPASFAARTAQALTHKSRCRLQLYVDDPALTLVGTRKWALLEGSLPILWWLVLGLDLSWRKGYFGNGAHVWIGVNYDIGLKGPTMQLPREYLVDTVNLLTPLTKPTGTIGVHKVQVALGKAARIGYVVPSAAPYVASLWAGFRQGRLQAAAGSPGTSPHMLPIRRFATAAKWLVTLISEALASAGVNDDVLTRTMGSERRGSLPQGVPVISFDASPWGGGALCWIDGVPVQHTYFQWEPSTLKILKAKLGRCEGQTSFEYATLFLVLLTFDSTLRDSGALIKGDNLSSLNEALRLKSTLPGMNTISREISWRKVAYSWQYDLAHLPSELNDEADALSRLYAEPRRELPKDLLMTSTFVEPPLQTASLWRARISYD